MTLTRLFCIFFLFKKITTQIVNLNTINVEELVLVLALQYLLELAVSAWSVPLLRLLG